MFGALLLEASRCAQTPAKTDKVEVVAVDRLSARKRRRIRGRWQRHRPGAESTPTRRRRRKSPRRRKWARTSSADRRRGFQSPCASGPHGPRQGPAHQGDPDEPAERDLGDDGCANVCSPARQGPGCATLNQTDLRLRTEALRTSASKGVDMKRVFLGLGAFWRSSSRASTAFAPRVRLPPLPPPFPRSPRTSRPSSSSTARMPPAGRSRADVAPAPTTTCGRGRGRSSRRWWRARCRPGAPIRRRR